MENYLIFFISLYFILFSIIGYGEFLSEVLIKKYNFSLCEKTFLGFFILVIISITTSFFINHGFYHNIILHLFGIFFFLISKIWKRNFQDFKILLLLSFFYLSGLLILKTHDDFGYYHLNYSRFLFDNNIFIGMGNLGHGFRTPSSLFFFNSVNFIPLIKFYSFHFSIYYIVLFSSFFFIKKIFLFIKDKNSKFIFFFLIFSFIYCTNIFYRFAEHGVDRSPQILLFVIVFLIFDILFYIKDKNHSKIILYKKLIFLIFLCTLAASMKALFFIYFLTILIFLKIIFSKNFIYKNLKSLLIASYLSLSIFIINFLNTGCILYPSKFTCFDQYSWSINKKEVIQMKEHYEWWAKAGGGPGYNHKLKKEIYIKNFNWIKNWIDRHFFNKISDNLLSLFVITGLIYFFLIFSTHKKKMIINKKINFNYSRYKKEIIFLIFVYFLIFFEWFLYHPAMRYGGFVIIAIPFFIIFSNYFSKFNFIYFKLKRNISWLLLLSLLIFNLQNFHRIYKETIKYQANIKLSPYFIVPKIKYKKKILSGENVYMLPVNTNKCWDTPTPCIRSDNYKIKKKYFFKILTKIVK